MSSGLGPMRWGEDMAGFAAEMRAESDRKIAERRALAEAGISPLARSLKDLASVADFRSWVGVHAVEVAVAEEILIRSAVEGDCLLWRGSTSRGYPVIGESRRSGRNTWWRAIHGSDPVARLTTSCGNSTCLHPLHLVPRVKGVLDATAA